MTRASGALLLGASSMFATMYSTQAILPELSRDLDASPAEAGLTVTVVVLAVALGGWVHGPLSDRVGRRHVMVTSAALLVVPTALLGLAPGMEALLALRFVQGALMPGLLVVAVPYVTERFHGPAQGRAMGAYTSSLVLGGFVGRVGTAVLAGWLGWRLALSSLSLLVAAGAVTMWRWLPVDAVAPSSRPLLSAVRSHLGNGPLLLNACTAGAAFFGFVGVFTYATYRLTDPPIDLTLGQAGLVYGVWLVGLLVTPITGLAGRIGPLRVVPWLLLLSIGGALATLVDSLPAIVLGLAAMALAMFTIVPACQLLIPRLADHHRGTATSLHLTVYYTAGGLGGYLPGFALDRSWATLVAACSGSVGLGLAACLGLRATGAGAAASRNAPVAAGDSPGMLAVMPEMAAAPYLSPEERDLVDRLRAGDEQAFMELVERYHPGMVRLARRFVSSQAVAEDVAQEAWEGVLRGIDRFEGRSSLRTWIYRILTNTAKTRGQRERRSVPFSSLDGDDEGPAVDPDRFVSEGPLAGAWASPPRAWDDGPEGRLLGAETREVIDRAIAALPPNQATVIRLRDIEGFPSDEVRELLDISEANQRVLLHRARSKVRAAIEAYMEATG